MLLKEALVKRDSFPIFLSIFFFLILLYGIHYQCEKYVFAGVFGGIIFICFFVDVRFLYYTYFASFFIGYSVINQFPLVVNVTDILFPFVLAARFGPHIFLNKPLSSFTPDRKILFFMTILFVVGVLSYGFNVIDHSFKIQVTGVWFLYRLFQAILVYIIFSDKDIDINLSVVFVIFIFFTLIQVPIALLQQMKKESIGYLAGATGTFVSHHSHMGTFLIVPIFLSHYFFRVSKRRSMKVFCVSFILVSTYLIFLSACRSAIIGLTISLLVMAVMHFKFKLKHILQMILIISGISIFLYISPFFDVFQKTLFSKETGTLDISSFSRLIIWRDSLVFFLKEGLINKLLGIGVGFSRETLDISFFFMGSRIISSSHNNYLTALIETGILGFVAFILIYTLILTKLYRAYKNHNNDFAFSMFFLTIAFISTSFTQDTFWTFRFLGATLLCYYTFVALALSNNFENVNIRT